MRGNNTTVYLADYQPYPFAIEHLTLGFVLDDRATQVSATMQCTRRKSSEACDMVLNGVALTLESVELDGTQLQASQYTLGDTTLTLPGKLLADKSSFQLTIQVTINPAANLTLEGLYKSNTMLCTQCEAEGFRRIVYFPDRPDVMTRYRVTIEGDAEHYPVMLSNGNPTEEVIENGIKRVSWDDPFHKPAYLFALVAGKLERIADSFTTQSGRKVALHMYVEEHNLNKCKHALSALKKAMRWDEYAYGREYDLDLFQIVATDDFNSGAMENKGLNIFNSECVLSHPDTSNDDDYLTIESIVAHEYFHNWSGNRVTLRDWFQLSLKEGFTVFRENQFVASEHSAKTKRVEEALLICTSQFAEDASPLRHPVRPASYQQIRNFYTLTVYEKGAEVIRMLHTLIGATNFRKGADIYFSRYDGQALQVEDLIQCMSEASGVHLEQFMRWYTQAGTPQVAVSMEYEPAKRMCHLTFSQSMPLDPSAVPLHIPIEIALYGNQGKQLVAPTLVQLTLQTQRISFADIAELPTPSLLRGFSAPVDLRYDYTEEELYLLLAHESDGYTRWKSAQSIKSLALLAAINDWPSASQYCIASLTSIYQILLRQILDTKVTSGDDDRALLHLLLTLPSYNYLCEQQTSIAVDATWNSRHYVAIQLGQQFAEQWQQLAKQEQPAKHYNITFKQIVKRRLQLLALRYIEQSQDQLDESTWQRYLQANNMTQREQALETMVWHRDCNYRDEALTHFISQAGDNPALINKWFEIQAGIPAPNTCELVEQLTEHKLFDWHNPNKLRALIGCFASRNPIAFHTQQGYRFFTDAILRIDKYNPQMAASLATPLYRWRRFQHHLSQQIHANLVRMADGSISSDLREGVNKSLEQP